MALVSSGDLYLINVGAGYDRSIQYEVTGGSGGPYLFSAAVAAASPSLGSLPRLFSDFYGHDQTILYGRVYITNNWSNTVYVNSTTYGIYSSANTDDTVLKFTDTAGTSSDTVFVSQGPAGQPFDSGQVTCALYRRTKQTSNAWGTAIQTWSNYTSQTASLDYTQYDYFWDIEPQ